MLLICLYHRLRPFLCLSPLLQLINHHHHHHHHSFRSPSACGMPTVSRLPQSMTSSVTASRSRWSLSPKLGCFLLLAFQPHGSSSICMALLLQVSIVALWVSLPWSLLGVLFLWLNSR
ncbi:hypothetical protein G6F24_017254 [Rhizopus arrhizus]|nr:hypothetical protein G6F24_017254 [Rhizopus arrhizus]